MTEVFFPDASASPAVTSSVNTDPAGDSPPKTLWRQVRRASFGAGT